MQKNAPVLGSKNGPVLGFAIIFLKQTSPQNGSIFGPQNGGICFQIFAPFDAIFLWGFPFAFCYGCCILTCLLIETGAWLVLVARQ